MKHFLYIFILILLSSASAKFSAQTDKEINLQQYTSENSLNIEVKEFFVSQIQQSKTVSLEDNHDLTHFFITSYDYKYKSLIKTELINHSPTILKSELHVVVDQIISIIYEDYKLHKKNNPITIPSKKIQSVDFINFSSETKKGLGDPCTNADFETGDATGWDLTDGQVNANPYEYINITPTSLNAQHVIVNGGNDPIIGATLPKVFPDGGGVSLQLGDGTGTGGLAAGVSQTFLVDSNSASFTYSYALVLEDPSGHTTGEKPFFKVNMYDENGDPISCGDYQVIAGPVSSGGDPDFIAYGAGPAGYYLPWRTTYTPLDAYIGQNVTIEFIIGDCAQAGHYGYGYIEASCSALEIVSTNSTLCGGDSTTLTAPAGASSYLWSPSGETTQSIITYSPGHYEVTVTPITGQSCGQTLTFDVNGAYTNLGNDTILCPNESLILDAGTGNYTYEWSTGDTTQTIAIDTALLGGVGNYDISVIVTDTAFSCSSTDTINVDFSICTGVNTLSDNINLSIYPNPNEGVFNLTMSTTDIEELEIKLVNTQGQIIYSKNSFDNISIINEQINLTNHAQGIYFLTITSEKGMIAHKIIVQ